MSDDTEERRFTLVVPDTTARCPTCGAPTIAHVAFLNRRGVLFECTHGHRWNPDRVESRA